MNPYVRLQRIPARMRRVDPRAVLPLARVLFLPQPDVLVVDVLAQGVHVAQVAGAASAPAARRHLLGVVVVLHVGRRRGRRGGRAAPRVLRDGVVVGGELRHRQVGLRADLLPLRRGRQGRAAGFGGRGVVVELDVLGEFARGVGGEGRAG